MPVKLSKPLLDLLRKVCKEGECPTSVSPLRCAALVELKLASRHPQTWDSVRVSPWIKVALGKRVSDELTRLGLDHVAMVHPAARGKIRKRERYIAHVKERLS